MQDTAYAIIQWLALSAAECFSKSQPHHTGLGVKLVPAICGIMK